MSTSCHTNFCWLILASNQMYKDLTWKVQNKWPTFPWALNQVLTVQPWGIQCEVGFIQHDHSWDVHLPLTDPWACAMPTYLALGASTAHYTDWHMWWAARQCSRRLKPATSRSQIRRSTATLPDHTWSTYIGVACKQGFTEPDGSVNASK